MKDQAKVISVLAARAKTSWHARASMSSAIWRRILTERQALLEHSDIEMVKRYARIAQTDRAASLWDCARAHQKASPVDNWRL
jgi:hypothetical protein